MVKLMQGDCLALMNDIPDGSVDMILCDLPYGVTRNEWDKPIPFDELWRHYKRVAKDNAAIVLFSQMPFTVDLIQSNRQMFRYEWIWQKHNPKGFLNSNRMPLKAHENICVFYKRLPTYNPQFWYGKPYVRIHHPGSSNYDKFAPKETISEDGKRFPVDIIDIDNSFQAGHHPTEKPVSLLSYLVRTYTDENETVLDNCMGSGSTGVACVNTGRNFIGIELNKGYFETAKRRIEEAKNKEVKIANV